jgi:hypothetical protein
MAYGIHFEVARFSFVPGEIGPDGNLVFKERSLPGQALAFEGEFFTVRRQPAVDSGTADSQEFCLDLRCDEGAEDFIAFKEVNDKADLGGQEPAAPAIVSLPDEVDHLDGLWPVAGCTGFFGVPVLSLTSVPPRFTQRVVFQVERSWMAYLHMYPVILMNSSRIVPFSFFPAFL